MAKKNSYRVVEREEIIARKIHKVRRSKDGSTLEPSETFDDVSVEKPLEIRVRTIGVTAFKSIAVTMRTPGQDQNLVTGFLYSEGIIKDPTDIVTYNQKTKNIAEVELINGYQDKLDSIKRNFFTSSSCGICSKGSLDQVEIESTILPYTSTIQLKQDIIFDMIEKCDHIKGVFSKTGGCHSMTLFDVEANFVIQQEDVGRHNAMDKLIGYSLLSDINNFSNHCVVVSGRLSFELIQKASMMGTAILIARGAPTSLAIEEAVAQNMCLIGFADSSRLNIYSGFERLKT